MNKKDIALESDIDGMLERNGYVEVSTLLIHNVIDARRFAMRLKCSSLKIIECPPGFISAYEFRR